MQSKPEEQGKAPTEASGTKPYHKPELSMYGDIVSLTKNANNIGAFDNIVMKT